MYLKGSPSLGCNQNKCIPAWKIMVLKYFFGFSNQGCIASWYKAYSFRCIPSNGGRVWLDFTVSRTCPFEVEESWFLFGVGFKRAEAVLSIDFMSFMHLIRYIFCARTYCWKSLLLTGQNSVVSVFPWLSKWYFVVYALAPLVAINWWCLDDDVFLDWTMWMLYCSVELLGMPLCYDMGQWSLERSFILLQMTIEIELKSTLKLKWKLAVLLN